MLTRDGRCYLAQMREKAGEKPSTKINYPVLKAIESDSYRLEWGIKTCLRYTAYTQWLSTNLSQILNDKIDLEMAKETLNGLFTSLDVVFHQLCRTIPIVEESFYRK